MDPNLVWSAMSAVAGLVSAVAAAIATYYAWKSLRLANLEPALRLTFQEQGAIWAETLGNGNLIGAGPGHIMNPPARLVRARVENDGPGAAKGCLARLTIGTQPPREVFVPSVSGSSTIHPGGGVAYFDLVMHCGTEDSMIARIGDETVQLPHLPDGGERRAELELIVTSEGGSVRGNYQLVLRRTLPVSAPELAASVSGSP